MSHRRIVAVFCSYLLAALTLIPSGAESGPRYWDFPLGRDFADFLLARDVVVIARILDAAPVWRSMVDGPCGALGPYDMLEVTAYVEDAPVGVVEDTLLTFSCLVRPQFLGEPTLTGKRILAWGSRDCSDAWRMVGTFCLLSDDGRVIPPMGGYGWDGFGPKTEPTASTVLSTVEGRGTQNALSLIAGSKGMALVQVRDITRGEPGVLSYDCRLVGVALGKVSNVPEHLDFYLPPGCMPEVAPGDTMLLPVDDQTSASYYRVAACPSALRTRLGFVPALGVSIASLSRVIVQDSLGLHLVSRSK